MRGWTNDEPEAIDAAEELDLASVRRDGTLRRPVTMWVVRHGDDLYVRSDNGRGSSWFRGARNRQEARIRTGGIEKHVSLVETDSLNDPAAIAHGRSQCVRCTGFQPRKRGFSSRGRS